MTQPKFNLSLSVDILNATLTALTAQQQALGNAIQTIKDQAQAQVDAAQQADADAAVWNRAAAKAATKAAAKPIDGRTKVGRAAAKAAAAAAKAAAAAAAKAAAAATVPLPRIDIAALG